MLPSVGTAGPPQKKKKKPSIPVPKKQKAVVGRKIVTNGRNCGRQEPTLSVPCQNFGASHTTTTERVTAYSMSRRGPVLGHWSSPLGHGKRLVGTVPYPSKSTEIDSLTPDVLLVRGDRRTALGCFVVRQTDGPSLQYRVSEAMRDSLVSRTVR